MPRFVILRHEFPPGHVRASHWDVMFEHGEVLRTWAVERSPDSPGEQQAERLADHRREYLTYEGPISDDRGTVTRWDEGDYETLRDDASGFEARVACRLLRGKISLTQQTYVFISAAPSTASSRP